MHLLSIYRTVYLSFRDLRVHQHLTRYNFLFVWGGGRAVKQIQTQKSPRQMFEKGFNFGMRRCMMYSAYLGECLGPFVCGGQKLFLK